MCVLIPSQPCWQATLSQWLFSWWSRMHSSRLFMCARLIFSVSLLKPFSDIFYSKSSDFLFLFPIQPRDFQSQLSLLIEAVLIFLGGGEGGVEIVRDYSNTKCEQYLGHEWGKIQSFLFLRFFSTGLQIFLKNVHLNIFVYDGFDKMKISHSCCCHESPYHYVTTTTIFVRWKKISFSKVLPHVYSTQNVVILSKYIISAFIN